MAVKTITIDLEAYKLLAREKRDNESFTMVIKRNFGRKRAAKDLLKVLRSHLLSDEVLTESERISAQMRAERLRR